MRESGVLMHITSLPGKHGIGTMGKNAYAFIDFLKGAGQSCWQILPLTPTGFGNSPYQSCSTFAGNHYLIDLDMLIEEGLLYPEEPEDFCWGRDEERVDFGALYAHRLDVLRLAYGRFTDNEALEAFCRENSNWLSDYALFLALRDANGGRSWYQWDDDLKFRRPDAVWNARQALRPEIRFYSFVQYLFFKQWDALRGYAHASGVSIIGDVPIYVPLDSADVWANPELFQLDKDLMPVSVAGVPPDGFTADGQLWGNPLYCWETHKKDGYSWWLRRMAAAGKLYDVVRLDHFRGLESYWAVPYGDATARNGRWVKGPGTDLTEAIKRELPWLRIIAEDLGYLTEEVLAMRDSSGYPGMKVLEFAFDSREPSDYLPHSYASNTVCYTGTHDNMTVRQWLDTCGDDALEYAKEYMRLSEDEGLVWGVIRTAMSSVSDLCIIPLQDYLDLGAEARMNFPGTMSDSNWTWRVKDGIISAVLCQRIQRLTALYSRLGNQKETNGCNTAV